MGTLDCTQTCMREGGPISPAKEHINAVDQFPPHRNTLGLVPTAASRLHTADHGEKFVCARIFMSGSSPKSGGIQVRKIEMLVVDKNLKVLPFELHYKPCTWKA